MLPNDDFFLACWMSLKDRKPRLRQEMERIELLVAGFPPRPKPLKANHEPEPQPDLATVL